VPRDNHGLRPSSLNSDSDTGHRRHSIHGRRRRTAFASYSPDVLSTLLTSPLYLFSRCACAARAPLRSIPYSTTLLHALRPHL